MPLADGSQLYFCGLTRAAKQSEAPYWETGGVMTHDHKLGQLHSILKQKNKKTFLCSIFFFIHTRSYTYIV